MTSLHLVGCALLLAGCSTVEAILGPVEPFHPPLPSAIQPVEVEIVVITPDLTREWNESIARGDRPPYVFFALNEVDYLSNAQWEASVRSWAMQMGAILKYYRKSVDDGDHSDSRQTE